MILSTSRVVAAAIATVTSFFYANQAIAALCDFDLLLLLGGALVHRLARVHRRGLALIVIVASLMLGSLTGITFGQIVCDLDGDGMCNISDLDALSQEIATNWGRPPTDPKYDLVVDGVLNYSDGNEWLSIAADENGYAEPYVQGDANLDGMVDRRDLNALALNWQLSDRVFSQGDFNYDGVVNAIDLMELGLRWLTSIRRADANVPEPMGLLLLLLGAAGVCHFARVRRRGLVKVASVPCLVLGLLTSVTTAQLACDLDGDGDCDVVDIDDLTREIASGMLTDPKFDLNMDGVLNSWDLDEWLAAGGLHNGFAAPYLHGDANLDGAVNRIDLNALALNWQKDSKVWSQGDFSPSGFVDAADLMYLGLNWQNEIPRAAATVPEPMSVLLVLAGAIGGWQLVNIQRRRRVEVNGTAPAAGVSRETGG